MPSKKKTVTEQLSAMSKEELIALITSDEFFFLRNRVTEDGINRAKGRVVREKAESAFSRWEELCKQEESPIPKAKGLEAQLAFIKRVMEREKVFKLYEKLSDRADRLEFGRTLRAGIKGAAHAE